MKRTQAVLAGIAFGLGITFFLHAQETATLTQGGEVSLTATNVAEVASLSDFEAELVALEATPSMPASQLPEETHGFYSVQSPDWPPLPGDVLGLNVWPLGNGLYALDDRNVNYVDLQAAAEATVSSLKQGSSRSGGLTPMFSLI